MLGFSIAETQCVYKRSLACRPARFFLDTSSVRYYNGINLIHPAEDFMEYKVNINGIDVIATYSDREVKELFTPLLQDLAGLQTEKGGRLLMMLAAPPGAGKSTLVSFLEHLAASVIPDKKVQAIGMDGFHRRQDYLLSHTTEVDGKEIRMVDIKGAPVTFDLDLLKGKLEELMSVPKCGWPVYNRLLHNPVDDAVFVDGDIVMIEGNYLLLDVDGWRDLSDLADYTVSIKADPDMLRERLIVRKIATGNERDKAERFVEFSDMANVRLCLAKTKPADLELKLSDGGFGLCDAKRDLS